MQPTSTRSLDSLRVVLLDPNANGPDPVYQVWPAEKIGWVNKTILQPGRLGQEFCKTFGHYHPDFAPVETYQLLSGKGVFIMQKKDLSKIFIVTMEVGDQVEIRPEWGHALVNLGEEELITCDNWQSGHLPEDYQKVKDYHGMAYYLIDKDGEVQLVPNLNYKDLPEPIWVLAAEFNAF